MAHLRDYDGLSAALNAFLGNIPHSIGVVGFDSQPQLANVFSSDTDEAAAAHAFRGDGGAAILDSLHYGIEVLRGQPSTYRRAILLISGTLDRSSKTSLEDAVRAIEDTNTAIYGFGFSSTLAAVKHEGSKLPGGGTYSTEPYLAGGCMSHDPSADRDAWQSSRTDGGLR